MANIKIYKRLFTFFIFADVQHVVTKVTHTDIRLHTYTEIDKLLAIGEILQFCLKANYRQMLLLMSMVKLRALPMHNTVPYLAYTQLLT